MPDDKPTAPTRAEREKRLADVDRLVESLVRHSGLPRGEFEDAKQEMMLLAWQLTEKFDPTRGVKFSTYVQTAVNRTLGKMAGAVKCRAEVQSDDWPELPDHRRNVAEGDDDESDTGAELFAAIQRSLTDGLLDAVTATHAGADEATLSARKIIESIAFDGLTVRDLAIQHSQPEKVIKANLKNAIRKLQRRGLTQHVADDAEVNAVLVPDPVRNEQQKAQKRRRAPKSAAFLADPWKPNPAAGSDGQEQACPVTPAEAEPCPTLSA